MKDFVTIALIMGGLFVFSALRTPAVAHDEAAQEPAQEAVAWR